MKSHPAIVQMRVADLRPHPDNPRGAVSADDVADLVEPIREHGVLQPLVVTPKRVILCGHRRHRAAEVLGLRHVPVIIRDADAREQFEIMLAENLARRDLTPLQEARAFQRLVDDGESQAAIARRLGVPVVRVRERLALLALDAETAAAFDRGDVPASALPLIKRTENAEERRTLVEELAERRTTVGAAKAAAGRRFSSSRGASPAVSPPATPEAPSVTGSATCWYSGCNFTAEPNGYCRPHQHLASRPGAAAPTPLPVAPGTPFCPRCHAERERARVAIEAMHRLETIIREQLGAGYVPERPPLLVIGRN